MKIAASGEPSGFEPTVFAAVRRYRTMVLVVVAVAVAAGVGYSLIKPSIYRAQASVTVPAQASLPGQEPGQYLDSQVLLLQSQDVARRAADIADGTLGRNRLTARDFSGNGSSLEITPPVGGIEGDYGATVIPVSFTWSSARIAQVGANAVLQAFNDVRSATIAAQANATLAGIDHAIDDSHNQGQRAALLTLRAQTVVNEQIDLAHQPTVGAVEPPTPTSSNWVRDGAIGLVIGIVVGAALAYARASRRRGFADRQDPAALYGVPMIGEIPAFEAEKTPRSNGKPAGGPLPMTGDPHSAVAEAFRFAAGFRRADPRRARPATVTGFCLAPRGRRQEHGRGQPGPCHRRRRYEGACRERRCRRWRPDRSAPARHPDGRWLRAGAGRTAVAGGLRPAQPV